MGTSPGVRLASSEVCVKEAACALGGVPGEVDRVYLQPQAVWQRVDPIMRGGWEFPQRKGVRGSQAPVTCFFHALWCPCARVDVSFSKEGSPHPSAPLCLGPLPGRG